MENTNEIKQKIIELISYKPKRLILINGKYRNKLLSILDERVFLTEPIMIKYLLELVLQEDKLIAKKAMYCINNVVKNFTMKDWIMIQDDLRSGEYYLGYKDYIPRKKWYGLKPDELDKLIEEKNKDTILLLGLLTFHNNGYIREKALILLNNYTTGEEILFILLRVNDWVSDIREISEKIILKRLKKSNLEIFISTMPVLYGLENCLRKDHNKLIRDIENFINKYDHNSEKILKYIDCNDKIICRKCYKLLLGKEKINKQDIIGLGLSHKDVIIQITAIKEIYKEVQKDKSRADYYYEILKNSKNTGIRKYAPDILVNCSEIDTIQEWKVFIHDTSSYARDISRYWLRKNGINNFVEIYKTYLKEQNNHLEGTIKGLVEVGTKEDADCLLKFIRHPKVKIKKIALKGIIRLDVEANTDILIESLSSEYIGVSRVAREGLEQLAYILDKEKLWEIVVNEKLPCHVLNNIIILFRKMPRWKSIILFLRLFDVQINDIEKCINGNIQGLINQYNGYVYPTSVQKNIIEKLYEKNYFKLSYENRIGIVDMMKRY